MLSRIGKGLIKEFSIYSGHSKALLNAQLDKTQFSKTRLVNHGELCDGEIPEALQYDRPYKLTTLPNGVRIATEIFPSNVNTVGIFIEAGSRNEVFEKSGVAHLLEHMSFKGTRRRTRLQIETEVENNGGNLNAYTSREVTLFFMSCFPNKTLWSLDMMTDMIWNSIYEPYLVEFEKETILRELEEVNGDPMEFVLENVHFSAYRDHILGQPILGNKRSIPRLTAQDIQEYVHRTYIGPRIVVVGVGDVNHDQIVEFIDSTLGRLPKGTTLQIPGEEECVFTPSCTLVRDDDVDLLHMGIFVKAPHWYSEDYYPFVLLQRLCGDYDPKKDAIINDPTLQYNSLQRYLGEYDDLAVQNAFYLPYKDTGLFGHFFSSLDISGRYIQDDISHHSRELCWNLFDHEIFRAKNKIYNELLNMNSTVDILQQLGHQLIYLKRRVTKKEIATRISNLTSKQLKKVYSKYLLDPDLAYAAYGPCDFVMHVYDENQHDWARMKDMPF